jgi:hypothetical protein
MPRKAQRPILTPKGPSWRAAGRSDHFGAHFNLLIGAKAVDLVSGIASHRSYLCEIRAADPHPPPPDCDPGVGTLSRGAGEGLQPHVSKPLARIAGEGGPSSKGWVGEGDSSGGGRFALRCSDAGDHRRGIAVQDLLARFFADLRFL